LKNYISNRNNKWYIIIINIIYNKRFGKYNIISISFITDIL
jgi:hypothetical protein